MDGTHSVAIGPSPQVAEPSGRYSRLFDQAEVGSGHSDEALHALAVKMVLPATSAEDGRDDSVVPAGYTYFAQIAAHDLSFQPSTLHQRSLDPRFVLDYRTPRFDLDGVYGRGPEEQPYLYEGERFVVGTPFLDSQARDLPRTKKGIAIIGDFRNDQNAILSQMHGLFLQLHNRLVEEGKRFEEAQGLVRDHYQYVVLSDLLPRLIGSRLWETFVERRDRRYYLRELAAGYRAQSDPAIALEFAAAVGRLGHSMVRSRYRLNRGLSLATVAPDAFDSLVGFKKPMNGNWGLEWHLFVDPAVPVERRLLRDALQMAYKIDASLAAPLARLPSVVVNLAERNLIRGRALRLPSGQAVATQLRLTPLPDDQILIGDESRGAAVPITEVHTSFAGNTPLWVYVQAEAAAARRADAGQSSEPGIHPRQLGEVGGRILAETYLGLLASDPTSILNREFEPTLGTAGRPFTLGSLIDAALS
jgi:hypothetical protein